MGGRVKRFPGVRPGWWLPMMTNKTNPAQALLRNDRTATGNLTELDSSRVTTEGQETVW